MAKGASIDLDSGDPWLAEIPEEEWDLPFEEIKIIKGLFCEPYGDRRCEIVCIGDAMNEAEIRKRFESCLLTEEEYKLGPEAWSKAHNPFELDVDEEEEDFEEELTQFEVGKYIVVDKAQGRLTSSVKSGKTQMYPVDEILQIVEIESNFSQHRIRGQVAETLDWVSIMDTSDSFMWLKPFSDVSETKL